MKAKTPQEISRRRFIQTTALVAAGVTTGPVIAFAASSADMVTLVIDPADKVASAPAARWAVSRLQSVLQAKGVTTTVVVSLTEAPVATRCVLVAGSTAQAAAEVLAAQKVAVPAVPEALGLVECQTAWRRVLLACGSDSRGLSYALLELADRVDCGLAPLPALEAPQPLIERPANELRSIYRCFVSEVEDKPWFYDREMWREYLTLLATQRINRFSLTFGMGYNTPNRIKESYFFFAYPFLFAVPGYEVRMGGLPDEERDHNLETLRFISEETAARGIHFQIGLWSHGREWPNSRDVNYPLLGLTEKNHGPYCRDALAKLLQECPAISGVTFRVHGESGVEEGSDDFWETLFSAFPKYGRQVEIDLHAKNATARQIELALATGMPVTVSPKYWGEQQGLGYIQTAIRARELGRETYVEQPAGVGLGSRSFTRYGYGDYLREDRRFGVLHRVWPGTQKLLLSGSPALSAAYGRVSSFCGGRGFELLDPLTFKGRQGTGHSGGRCAYADPSLNPRYDWEKFLYTYRLWGRLGYNPDADPEIWRRFLRQHFGQAEPAVEAALANASQVLPLVTTAHGPSADCFRYWPEIYTNMPIVDPKSFVPYADTDSPKQFGNVSPFDPQLFSRINEYADALLAARSLHKYTPIEVARHLEVLGDAALDNLARAAAVVPDSKAAGFRRLAADVSLQAGLAQFFAAKMRSAVLWRIHEQTADAEALTQAVAAYRRARDTWSKMAEAAKAVYVSDISFGANANVRGDWLGRLPAINADLAGMEKKLAVANPGNAVKGDPAVIKNAVESALAQPRRNIVVCRHTPDKTFKRGVEMPIEVIAPARARGVILYYRQVNQALLWQRVPMKVDGGVQRAVIPAAYTRTHYPMQYYFVVETSVGTALYPGLDEQFMNQPYYLVRLEKGAS